MNSVRRTTRTPIARKTRSARAGFTLLEMLVTAILSAVLLAGLWTLFNTYMRLFESGQIKTEQSQLVRALAQQVADDLRAVVAVSAAEPQASNSSIWNSTSGTSSASATQPAAPGTLLQTGSHSETDSSTDRFESRSNSAISKLPKFRLVGTLHALRLDALQPGSAESEFSEEESTTTMTRSEEHVPPVPELRTIVYSFEEEREVRETDRKTPPGLLRVDIDWQHAMRQSSMRRKDAGSSMGTDAAIDESLESLGLGSTGMLELLSDDAKMHVPEVVHCEFHYFDGSDWLEEWDSDERKSLPSAVEVTLRLDPPPERWKQKPAKTADAASETPVDSKDKSFLPTDMEDHRPVYRQVIALAAAPQKSHGIGSSFGSESTSAPMSSRRSSQSRSGVMR